MNISKQEKENDKRKRTAGHELRPARRRKHNKMQHLTHLEVAVRSTRDDDRTDRESRVLVQRR